MTSRGDSWRLRWTQWRNRLIASPVFQRRVASTPLLRRVAQGHARALFDVTAGFVYAQTAAAMVESKLVEALGERALTLDEAAATARLPADKALVLLRAAAALDLTEELGGRWTLGLRGAALAGTPGVAAMIAHHRLLYADLADPLALLRGDKEASLAGLWRYEADAERQAAAYSELMAASQPMVAAQALAAYRFGRHRKMLDVGGGEGAFAAAVAAAAPRLQLGLFDLPAVAERAREHSRLGARLAIHQGDFRVDPVPSGYDLVTLVRVLHDHDDGPAARLLAAIRAALTAGGRLLIVEPMAGTRGAEPAGHAYFGFYLTAMGSGRPRTPAEIGAMVREAGFSRSRVLRTPIPLIARAIVAHA